MGPFGGLRLVPTGCACHSATTLLSWVDLRFSFKCSSDVTREAPQSGSGFCQQAQLFPNEHHKTGSMTPFQYLACGSPQQKQWSKSNLSQISCSNRVSGSLAACEAAAIAVGLFKAAMKTLHNVHHRPEPVAHKWEGVGSIRSKRAGKEEVKRGVLQASKRVSCVCFGVYLAS